MNKVLIVDDEPSIREGLQTLIDWKSFGFQLCGEAANGTEGLRLCTDLAPDLVLADIRMPGMDGLAMIEEAQKLGLSCRFMVLTGYSEFQYAKKAIEQGVDCYLLKPIDAGELERQVARLQRQLARDRIIRAQAIEGKVRQTERLIQKLVCDAGSPQGTAAYGELAERIGFPWKGYRVLLIEMDPKPDTAEISLQAKEMLRSDIEGGGFGYLAGLEQYSIVLLNENAAGLVKSVIDKLRKRLLESAGHGILVYAGNTVRDAAKLTDSLKSAFWQVKHRFLLGSEDGFWLEGSNSGEQLSDAGDPEAFDLEAAAGRLAMAVDAGHEDTIAQEGEQAVRRIVREDGFEPSIKMRTAMLYISVFQRLLSADSGIAERLAEFRAPPAEWNGFRSLDALRAGFLSRLSQLSAALNRDRPGGALLRILEFIRRHYDKDLKLEMLAEMYHYNSGYLGKMFRQQTGEYFNTYLDRIRIENAKELLKQGLKVHQVAAKVGYANVDYFHAKFKKYVGMPPSVYREHKR